MRNTYITLSALTIIYLITLVYAFSQIGSPFDARSAKVDQTRVSNLQTLKYRIENYYTSHRQLPQSLSNLSVSSTYEQIPLKDPVTNQFYGYYPVDFDRYQMCATFDTSNQKPTVIQPQTVEGKHSSFYSPGSYNSSFLHPKGYYCFDLEIPDYLKTQQLPTPFQRIFPSPPPLLQRTPTLAPIRRPIPIISPDVFE